MILKRLDRYLLAEFFSPLLLIVLGFASLVSLIQAVDSLPAFRDAGAPVSLVLAYHVFNFPLLVAQVTPLGVMLSTLVAFGSLARHGEISAMHSGGVSTPRLVLPLAITSLCISVALFLASEYLVPFASDDARHIREELIEHHKGTWGGVTRDQLALDLSQDRQCYIENFNAEKGEMRGVVILKWRNGALAWRTDALLGRYTLGSWTLMEGMRRTFGEDGTVTDVRPFDRLPGDIDMGPYEFLVNSSLSPQELLELPTWQLARIIAVLKKTGSDYAKERVCYHVRVSFPFSCLVLTLLGASLSFLFPYGRRAIVGAAFGLLASVAAGLVYLVLVQVGISLGKSGILPPAPSAWIANIVFLVVGLLLLKKASA